LTQNLTPILIAAIDKYAESEDGKAYFGLNNNVNDEALDRLGRTENITGG